MQNVFRSLFLFLSACSLLGCGASDDVVAPDPAGGPDAAPGQAASEPDTSAPVTQSPAAGFQRKPAPDGARVYFVSPSDGDVVPNPVRVVFGLQGMGVAPAGIASADAGHHHLLVDTDPPPLSQPIPADENHIHFGLGQTETELTLEPGEHRLQLLLGDELHVPHDPPVLSDAITIRVE